MAKALINLHGPAAAAPPPMQASLGKRISGGSTMTGSPSPKGPNCSLSMPDEEKRQKAGIQSVERAFSILECIAHTPAGATLSELSKHLEIHTSTIFHLVQTLVALGYVRQLRDNKRYRIGRPLFALAAASDEDAEFVSIVTPILQSLSGQTGEAGHFGVWSGQNILVLARSPGAGAFQLTSTVGVVRPAFATGLGKALLASLTDAELDRYLAHVPLHAFTDNTIADVETLLSHLQEIRNQGIAFDDGEFDSEIRCVAAVARNAAGRPIGSIGISGPVWRMTPIAVEQVSRHVREAAKELSKHFRSLPASLR